MDDVVLLPVDGARDEVSDPADAWRMSEGTFAIAPLLALWKGLSRSMERSVKTIRGAAAVLGLKTSRPEEPSSIDIDLEVLCWEG
jgi:hypothetical protein